MQPKNHKFVPRQRRLALNRGEFVWRSSWRTNRQVGRQLHKLHPRGEAVTANMLSGENRSTQSRQIFVHLHLRNEGRMGALSCNWETKRGRTVTLTRALWWLVCSRVRCWELRRLCIPAGWCCRDLGLRGWSSGCTCYGVQTASQSQKKMCILFHKMNGVTILSVKSCISLCIQVLCNHYLRLGLKSTYSSACVELLAVEIKLKSRKTRSGTPRSWVSCLWMTCSRNDICCCVFLRNRYHPITFYKTNETKTLF